MISLFFDIITLEFRCGCVFIVLLFGSNTGRRVSFVDVCLLCLREVGFVILLLRVWELLSVGVCLGLVEFWDFRGVMCLGLFVLYG